MTIQELDSVRQNFRDDGVVCIRQALNSDSMRMALEGYEWSLSHPSVGAAQVEGTPEAPAKFYQDLFNPNALPAYRRLLENSKAADVIAKVWGVDDVWFFYEQVFLKEGGESRRTPWHQDSSYLPITGDLLAVMWISFDLVAIEDSLEFVRGSHRGVTYDGSRFDPNDDTAPLYGDGSLPRLPNIEAERDRWDILSWAVEPGDVLVFHPGILHGGAGTRAGRRRRTLSLRFFGQDAVFAPRPGWRPQGQSTDPRGALEDLNRKLQPGDPFRHPTFPKLRPRI